MKWTDFLFLREGICLSCREEETDGAPFCPICMAQFEEETGAFYYDDNHLCHIAFFYNRHLKRLMHTFKFQDQAELAEPLGRLFVEKLLEKNVAFDCVMAVPMTKKAERKRGYNQSALFAEAIAEAFQKPCVKPIEKVRTTKEQNKLSRTERQQNLKGAFALVDAGCVRGKRVLLVDDFVTTGSTLSAVTQVLESAEPAMIAGAAFAAPRLYTHDTLHREV